MQTNQFATSARKGLALLGPGIITAALVFGPGSLTITSKMGAGYGYRMLWVIALSICFMFMYIGMGARIGMASSSSLLSDMRSRWGRPITMIMGLGIFLITTSFQAGNTIGAALAFSELSATSTVPWVLIFTTLGIALLFARSFYQVLEKIMLAMVGLMLVSFFLTLILVKPNLSGIIQGLVPSLPEGSEMLTIALIASSFSMVAVFYQAYLVKEKRWTQHEVKQGVRESQSGVLVLGLISSFILINAASVLHSSGIEVNSATDMGRALEPLFGRSTTVIFMMGMFGASFSSLVGNATIGGALLADAFSWGNQLNNKRVKGLIMVVMIIGALIALYFDGLPLELIVFAQATTILIAPLIGIALLIIANDRRLMGPLKNNRITNLIGVLGLLLLVILLGRYIFLMFIQ